MKFFTEADFILSGESYKAEHHALLVRLTNQANAKLEREGKILTVYDKTYLQLDISEPKCTHPEEKVINTKTEFSTKNYLVSSVIYHCKCGAKVKPKTYEVIE